MGERKRDKAVASALFLYRVGKTTRTRHPLCSPVLSVSSGDASIIVIWLGPFECVLLTSVPSMSIYLQNLRPEIRTAPIPYPSPRHVEKRRTTDRIVVAILCPVRDTLVFSLAKIPANLREIFGTVGWLPAMLCSPVAARYWRWMARASHTANTLRSAEQIIVSRDYDIDHLPLR